MSLAFTSLLRSNRQRTIALFTAALLLGVGLQSVKLGFGSPLPNRSLRLGSSIVSATTTYNLLFSLGHVQTLGSIQIQFCSEGPLDGTPCTTPAGFSASGVSLGGQTGETGFTISPSSTINRIILTRAPAASTQVNVSYILQNITNPSTGGTFYARILTFSSNDASGAFTDYGGLALSTRESLNVTAVVPPFLYFCLGLSISGTDCGTAAGDYINFGVFNTIVASTAETQMVVATNGPTGYAIRVSGSTLTSGNDVIPALAANDVSRPGVSQFGMNLVRNTSPVVGENPSGDGSALPTANYQSADQFRFVSGEVVAQAPEPDLPRKFTTSYIANVMKGQAPGIYVSTLTYVATAGF